ncbi:MAG: multidrug efflux system outer membrane protein [Gammaproteobacteria bacterium]
MKQLMRARALRMLFFPLMAVLHGCANIEPVYTQLADSGLTPPAQWHEANDSPGAVNVRWLDDFADARLAALVEESFAGNLNLRAIAARVRIARSRATIAGAAQLPTLDLGGGASRRSAQGISSRNTTNSFDATLSAAWDVDLWDRLADTTRAAAFDALGSEADLEAARELLAANIARGWFKLIEASAQVALAQVTVDNFRDNLAVVEDGFRSGLNIALDVRLERANLANAQSRLEARRRERDAAVRTLEVQLGRYPAGQLDAGDVLPQLSTSVPAGLPAQLLNRRPDLQAAQLRLSATDARLAAALKNRLPDFTLTASGGLSSDTLSRLLNFDALLLSIAGGLAAPLLRGGALDAERELARAQTMVSLATYAEAVLVAFREVESALNAELTLARQEDALRSAVIEARAAEKLALERYRAGLTGIITWLEARRRAFETSSSLLSINNQRIQNRIALHLALGGDFGRRNATHAVHRGAP